MLSKNQKMALIAAYFTIAIVLGIHPHDRSVWALENCVPLAEAAAAVLYYRWRNVEFTRLAYICIFSHLVVQMIGGHYNYEREPLFEWLNNAFHWSRNHYDRLAHFALGFCLYVPIREICLRRTPLAASKRWAVFFTFTTITAVAGLWEVWEWAVAVMVSPEAGTEYLGLQGDPWDAQKDILMAPIGVLAAIFIFTQWHDRLLIEIRPSDRKNA